MPNPKTVLVVVIGLTALPAGAATAAVWPHAFGAPSNSQCRQAYQLAAAAFKSTNASLLWPIEPPRDLGSVFSLYTTAKDISGGDGLSNNPKTFSEISSTKSDGKALRVFWQDRPGNGKRIVVTDEAFNEDGDFYTTYVLNADIKSTELTKYIDSDYQTKPIYEPLLGSNRWNPPRVLTDNKTGASWLIDSGEPYQSLADWRVYTVDGGGARSSCIISFRPKAKLPVSLMPEPVRRFSNLLDAALGPGRDEGTLQPTARIRVAVAQAWANASFRPWALIDAPYNTRAEVDDGLKHWADGSVKRLAVYKAIRAQYSGAREALTNYYEHRFKLPTTTARKMGAYVADLMYREYFVLPRENKYNGAQPSQNPWPSGIR